MGYKHTHGIDKSSHVITRATQRIANAKKLMAHGMCDDCTKVYWVQLVRNCRVVAYTIRNFFYIYLFFGLNVPEMSGLTI